MQSQERELIIGLFGRLQSFESQPRDGEAEALIRDLVQAQPASSYLLVQTVLVQEQTLKAAQARITELEAKTAAQPAAPPSFLGNAPSLGPWGAPAGSQAAAPPPRASVPSTSIPPTPTPAPLPMAPSTRSPLQAAVSPPQSAGGGFLRTAMATAAGVAGGALLFEGIRNLMGGSPFGQSAAAQPAPLLPPDAQQQADQQQADQQFDPQQQDSQQAFADDNPMPSDLRDDGYDTAAYDDGGMGGGDDDWT